MNRYGGYILIAAAAAGLGWALFYHPKESGEAEPSGRTVAVEKGEVVSKIAETGSIEPAGLVEIKSEQSGEIKKLFVAQGDRVKPGDLLAVIQQESSQARQAAQFRAAYEEERLNKEEAEREARRQGQLLEKGFVSRKDVEVAEKNLETAHVRFQLARRQLLLVLGGSPKVLDQYLSRDLDSDALDRFDISSPIAGTVISLEVEPGEIITSGTSTVGGGTTLVKIADLTQMLVVAKINEVNIVQVRLGQPVEMTIDAVPDKKYRAEVVQISPQGERVNNVVTYPVTMKILDPDPSLKPGMTANVDIITAVTREALYVPVEAVRWRDGRASAAVWDGSGESERPIETGVRTATVIQVTKGLGEGDRVVIRLKETP